MTNYSIKKTLSTLVGLTYALSLSSNAQVAPNATFEIGEGTIPVYSTTATEATPFFEIPFDGVFASTPNVFVVTPQNAGDPCIIRIVDVDVDHFDATCHEPFDNTSDRNLDAALTFEYIAIQDGGLTVPLSDGSGDVVLESSCSDISAQQWGNRCSACSGSETFTPITFTNSFSAAPAVLTQIQTVNNDNQSTGVPSNEPEFISTAVQTSSLTSTGFNLAIERLEAGTVPLLTVTEEICYLAAETSSTCQLLDFSSFGGPTMPVMFQALNTLRNINGQETSGETTNFASGCFTSTPVAFATQTSRAGGDGGYIRRVSTATSGVTLIVDEDTVEDGRSHSANESASILSFGQVFTTPVTLTSAKVSKIGRRAIFDWETSAETFNLGFNLWGETSEGWVQLNRVLIKGNGVDSSETQSYRESLRLNRNQDSEISKFGISSVDSTGYEEFYGPFSEGQAYGEEANNEPVDWTSTRKAFEQSMADQGFTNVNGVWRRLTANTQALVKRNELGIGNAMFDIQIEELGIHSINASDLIALNPAWDQIALRQLALTVNGNAVPRHIISHNNRLDAGDRIVFNSSSVSESDAPFLDTYTYRLSINRDKARDANVFDGSTISVSNLKQSALITEILTAKKLHSPALTTGDPWYDTRLLSVGQPESVNYTADFNYPIDTDKTSVLDLVLFGSLDFPGEQDDHHIQVNVNGDLVSDVFFDGLTAFKKQIVLPEGLLSSTGNIVSVTVVGDTGHFADVVLVDEIRLSAFSELSNKTRFDFAHDFDAEGYQLTSNNELEIYAYTDTGLLTSVASLVNGSSVQFESLPFQVNTSSNAQLRYVAANQDAWPSPSSIDLVYGDDLHSKQTDYLIVAHPSFVGDELNAFAKFKTGLGYNVRIVDWLSVVNTYGYGNNTPSALNNLLRVANDLYTTDNVLIVGGHTYDYFGITNDDIVNFIPSHYRAVSVFEYTATDNPYADLNGDNVPEIAIGRWPVRSVADLRTIINKTTAWHANRENDQYQSAYLIAQAQDSQSLNFAEQLDARVASPLSQIDGVELIAQLNLGVLPEGVTNVVEHTRSALAEEINSGTELISFSGHASPTAWGFQNVINTNFVKSLENQGEPVLLMPLACYITHFEDISTNTLAHQWLFAGDQGAAAIHGASVLGEYRENGLFAEQYIKQTKDTKTVGEAIRKAKQSVGSNNEILHNWALLGDPTLPIR